MTLRTYIIIAALAGSNLITGLATRSYYLNAWETERSAATAAALTETLRVNKERAAEATARDNNIRNLESDHESERSKIRAAADAADRTWADRLRRIAASCHRPGVSSSVGPGGVSEAVAAERDRRLEGIRQRLRRVGEGYNELAARDRLCVATWAEVAR